MDELIQRANTPLASIDHGTINALNDLVGTA